MYHAAQDAPDQDVPTGDYFRTGIYITEHNYTAIMMDGLAGTYGTPQKESIIRISWVMLICRRLFACQLCSDSCSKSRTTIDRGRRSDLVLVAYRFSNLFQRCHRHLIMRQQSLKLIVFARSKFATSCVEGQGRATKETRSL